jgi:hypothetical protein
LCRKEQLAFELCPVFESSELPALPEETSWIEDYEIAEDLDSFERPSIHRRMMIAAAVSAMRKSGIIGCPTYTTDKPLSQIYNAMISMADCMLCRPAICLAVSNESSVDILGTLILTFQSQLLLM